MTRFVKRLVAAAAVPSLVGLCCLISGAAIGISWTKSSVVPVVLVKPGIGGFEPAEGSSIGNTWTKSEVKAVVLVMPGIGGFEPREGTSIGNTWSQQQVIPVMLVEPSLGAFVPLRTFSEESGPSDAVPSTLRQRNTDEESGDSSSASVIETQIDGDFEGWDGKTIVKLTNGQIWQQTEYHYNYHYAFRPKALVFKSDGGYKMKVDGTDQPVGVKRLK